MRFLRTIAAFFIAVMAAFSLWNSESEALSAYKSGDYKKAIPLLEALSRKAGATPETKAALLSALTYEGRTESAATLETELAQAFPNHPAAMTARGDFYFYMGDLASAEKLFRSALKIGEDNARAQFGMFRLLRSASYYKSARISCMRAHALDPDDALLTLAFLRYTVGEKRREMLEPFMSSHPWFAQASNFEAQRETAAEVHDQLAERKAFELQGTKVEATVPLTVLRHDAIKARGVGIQVSINGNKPLRLMLDTGASGILLTESAVNRAGMKHVGSMELWGIGEGQIRKGFLALAQSCTIGTLQFKNCIFQAQEGKERIANEEDGLVGTDFFEDYLIHLDFQRLTMTLKPMAERPEIVQGYDRTVPSGEEKYTPVFRFGHGLYLPTAVNGKSRGMFLIDTGSNSSLMDATFARLSTKLHGNDYMRVRGVSGKVKDVFEADKAELQFGHFRERNIGLVSVNLNDNAHHQEMRVSGILGMPVLTMFRMDIDYRNGLVNLDYVLK